MALVNRVRQRHLAIRRDVHLEVDRSATAPTTIPRPVTNSRRWLSVAAGGVSTFPNTCNCCTRDSDVRLLCVSDLRAFN